MGGSLGEGEREGQLAMGEGLEHQRPGLVHARERIALIQQADIAALSGADAQEIVARLRLTSNRIAARIDEGDC